MLPLVRVLLEKVIKIRLPVGEGENDGQLAGTNITQLHSLSVLYWHSRQ